MIDCDDIYIKMRINVDDIKDITRLLVCSFKYYKILTMRYGERREIIANRNCPVDQFFYWSPRNQDWRRVQISE